MEFFLRLDAGAAEALQLRDRFFPGRPIIEVPLASPGPVGACHANVRRRIRAAGGQAQCGWLLRCWPGRLIEALHHSVWRSPAGRLFDVTAAPDVLTGRQPIAFIAEGEPMRLPQADPLTPSKFIQLDQSALTADYIEVAQRAMVLSAAANDFILSNGRRKASSQAFTIPAEHAAEAASRLEAVRALTTRRDELLDRLFREDAKLTGAPGGPCACGSGALYEQCHALFPKPG